MRTRRLMISVAVVVAVLGALVATPAGATGAGAGSAAGLGPARQRACRGASEPTGTPLDAKPMRGTVLRGCLKLNQIQVIGSHNSYHLQTNPAILDVIRSLSESQAQELEYAHSPLPDQFSDEGVRQIELDVFADPVGGLYAGRPALTALGQPNVTPPELLKPGFKVLHIQDIDFNTTCLTFVECLKQVRRWSDTHVGHLPITILVELKDGTIPDPFNLGFVTPLHIGGPELDALDAEIRSVFRPFDLITPDDVRGSHATLEESVLAGGWPTLDQARGKVMFLMDNSGEKRDLYRAGRPSLEGRVLFTNSEPGSPDAAFVERNDPIGSAADIPQLVADGYVVRTRSDEPTFQARSGDTTMRDAALASGAQWVSTDYPVPGLSIWSDYVAMIPDGQPARCNPINAGPRCHNDALEKIRVRQPR